MKYFVLGILVTFGLVLYLNRAYAHIFSFLNEFNPGNPTTHMTFIIPSPVPTSSARITYVALGDSLTAGAGATKETESYPYRLAQRLAEGRNAEVTLVNLGQPGANTIDVLNNQVPAAVALHPDFITLAIGINDLHNNVPDEVFQKNLISIVNGLSGATKNLNVITIPFLAGKSAFWPPYRAYFDWKTRNFNELLRISLSNKNVSIIDLYSLTHERALNDADYYSPDGFHASAKAYDFWSKILYDHLNY